MADIIGRVQGSIGSDEVNLVTNAATEATLSKLLQATLAIGTKNKEALEKLAKQFDLNSDSIENFNNQLDRAPAKFNQVYNRLERFEFVVGKISPMIQMVEKAMGQLAAGTAQASDMFKTFGQTPIIGALNERYGKLLAYQEENMKSYQQLTTAGVNFAGNLGEIRESAANMYLTLDQFTKLMTEGSSTFARMGATVDQGALAFRDMSKSLNQSDAGTYLRSLGYTSQEVNEGLLRFLSTSGTANRTDLESKKALETATSDYLGELDKLTKFTGTSKKQVEEEQNKIALNAAYQRKLLTMTPAEKAKQDTAMAAMISSGVKGSTDALMSLTLGLPPATDAARAFTSIMPDAAQQVANMSNHVKDSSATMDNINKDFSNFAVGVKGATDGLGIAGDAMVMFGKGPVPEAINSAIAFSNTMTSKGIKTAEDALKQLNQTETDQGKQAKSQAAQMARIQGDMFEATKAVTKAMQALVNDEMYFLEKSIHKFAKIVESAADKIANNAGITNSVINGGLLTLGAVGTAITTKTAIEQYKLLKGMRPETLGSGGVSSIIDPSTGKPFAKAASTESEALLGATKSASKALKGVAVVGTALTVGMAAGDYADIEKKRKQGLLSAEDAKTQKGGVVGGAAGGLGGAAAGAAAGGAIGTAFFGVGAIPGAIIGGMIGGFLGESAGKSIGENIATADKTTAAEEAKAKEEEQKKTEDIKTKSAGEILQASVDRLNTTMEKMLIELSNIDSNTEETAKGVKNNSYIKR